MAQLATYELDGKVATITLDDGKVNAFSIPMLKAAHDAFDQAQRDEALVILTGRPGYLSAGFDLKVFAAGGEPILEMLTLGATLAERILAFPTPVVVACPGHAVAAGSFILLAADLRIGVEGPFRMGLNEVSIGLTVPWFAVELARARLTPAQFDRTVVNAQLWDPQVALSAGLLDRVVAPEELATVAQAAALELSGLNMAAHAATKLRARGGALAAVRSAIETELTPALLEQLGAGA